MRTRALICSAAPLDDELAGTVLWRNDVERRLANDAAFALQIAQEAQLQIVVVDRNLPAAAPLVGALRGSPRTRATSIVVVARGDFDPLELDLLSNGANAVLRFPPDQEWDERLRRLLTVPVRREVRLPVHMKIDGSAAAGPMSALATALNLSANGMLVESDGGLELGDVLELAFRLPGFDAAVIARGKVMRLAGQSRQGVEFLALREDGADIIRCFVGTAGGASASR